MTHAELKAEWLKKYQEVPQTLARVAEVKAAATAFNTNIDAVLKISGKRIAELMKAENLSLTEARDIRQTKLLSGVDVIKGIVKCFERGIAEEWLTEDKDVYQWMADNLGYDRLQMGGQGGIVANALAVAGVQKVYAHTNSLPKLQAQQFLDRDNLLSFDENGRPAKAAAVDRKDDVPLIHWIIEFDKGDVLEADGEKIVCPKSNRFIATYDPLNLNLVIDDGFVKYLQNEEMQYIVLSGYHALTASSNGVALLEKSVPVIKSWKQRCPQSILHLEIASTQDIEVRRAIVEKIAPLCDSIGVNEREAIDILEVIGEKDLACRCEENTDSVNLFEAILRIKRKLGVPRVQLHMFGLYLTLQSPGFVITPEANLRGMSVAATVAASKAGTGNINKAENLLWAQGREVSDVGLTELESLAAYLYDERLPATGLSRYDDIDIIALPTILVEKPLTLVGMGDTISSISLISSR